MDEKRKALKADVIKVDLDLNSGFNLMKLQCGSAYISVLLKLIVFEF